MDSPATAPRPPNDHPSRSIRRFLESNKDIPAIRDLLDGWLRVDAPDLDELRIFEIVLAANELLCNALEHGAGGCIVYMRRTNDALTVTVNNRQLPDQPSIAPSDSWAMPDATSPTGRGLAIAKNVADSIGLTLIDDVASVAATFELRPEHTHSQQLAPH